MMLQHPQTNHGDGFNKHFNDCTSDAPIRVEALSLSVSEQMLLSVPASLFKWPKNIKELEQQERLEEASAMFSLSLSLSSTVACVQRSPL